MGKDTLAELLEHAAAAEERSRRLRAEARALRAHLRRLRRRVALKRSDA